MKSIYIKFLAILIFSLLSPGLKAQETLYHQHEFKNYWIGLDYFQKQKFSIAQKYFQTTIDELKGSQSHIKSSAEYYRALCAINLFNDDAEYLTMQFIASNPESPKKPELYFHLANYFYTQKKWDNGMKYFSMLDWEKLSDDQQSEFHFKQGYCLFELGKIEEAKLALYKIKDQNTKFSSAALYYYSHIHYEEKNYQTALNGFLELGNDKYFGSVVPYYIVQIYYEQKKYDEITRYVPGIINNVTEKRIAEVSRIAAESFYYLKKYPEAIPYFVNYYNNAQSVSKEDKYQLAYSYYKADSILKAIEIFSNISTSENKIGQNASYYLADCYLKTNDMANARKAFASASRKDFDPEIKEDALFNYAILSYKQPNDPFNEAIHAFEEYLQMYKNTARANEASKYLVQSYLKTKNYTKALESIEKLNIDNNELKKAYLRIAYNRGIELFNNLNFNEATSLFTKALKYGKYDKELYTKTLYWNAEASYRLKNYTMAIDMYKEFKNSSLAHLVENYELADYSIGYAYFQLKDYENAVLWLQKFTGKADKTQNNELADAFNRIADAYYMQSGYNMAITNYKKAVDLNVSSADYAYLQIAICNGLLNKNELKIENINTLIGKYPRSSYADNAEYEKAQAYINLQQSEKAISSLKTLTTTYPNSELRATSMVQLGLLYYNLNQNQEAISILKQAITGYPGTQASRDALTGLKNVYIDINQVEDYANFIASLGDAGPQISVSEKDSLVYISAENLYMSGDCEKASTSFEKYIQNYPNGSFLVNAHFYKADCNYQQQKYPEALKSFEYVIANSPNVFTSQALLSAGRLSFKDEKPQKAIDYYSQLLNKNTSPGNKQEASTNIMRSYYKLGNYKETIEQAKTLMESDKLPPELKREAGFLIAKSYHGLGRSALALEEFKTLSNEVVSKQGAESKYMVAQLQYDNKEYEASEKTILEFSNLSTPHEHWIARSFILWADIFMQRNDAFQAIETVQSIIDYYENMDDGILELAKSKKQAYLKVQEADEAPAESGEVEIEIGN